MVWRMLWRLLAVVSIGAWVLLAVLLFIVGPHGEDRGAMVGIGIMAEDGASFELLELSVGGVTPPLRWLPEGQAELPRMVTGPMGTRTPILPPGPTLLRLRFRPVSDPRIITVETELKLEGNTYCELDITLGRAGEDEVTPVRTSRCKGVANLFWGQPDF